MEKESNKWCISDIMRDFGSCKRNVRKSVEAMKGLQEVLVVLTVLQESETWMLNLGNMSLCGII